MKNCFNVQHIHVNINPQTHTSNLILVEYKINKIKVRVAFVAVEVKCGGVSIFINLKK